MIDSTIELDCPPLTPRPDTYFHDICEKFGLKESDPISKCFGNWEWNVQYPDEETKNKVAEYIKGLYYSGAIRYGSW